jgi:hypothetical protein
MDKKHSQEMHFFRSSNLLWPSLNVGLGGAIILRAYLAGQSPSHKGISLAASDTIAFINDKLDLYPSLYNPVGVELTFLLCIATFSAFVFVAARLVAQRSSSSKPIRVVACFASLAAVPAGILCAYTVEAAGKTMRAVAALDGNAIWLALETVVVVALLMLHVLSERQSLKWAAMVGLTIHLIIWVYIIFYMFPPHPWAVALSFVPISSGLVWLVSGKSGEVTDNRNVPRNSRQVPA